MLRDIFHPLMDRVRTREATLGVKGLSDIPFTREQKEAMRRDLALLDPPDRAIVTQALPHTMTGIPRLTALIDAVRHLTECDVPGAFAECGVWRGGSVLAMILTLLEAGVTDRHIYLYDTFAGMTKPTDLDVSRFHEPAADVWSAAERTGQRMYSGLFDSHLITESSVRRTIQSAGYPSAMLHFVAGDVEQTLPAHAPERIALLRLDTDWYVSTKHELQHLYPRLTRGGVLIIDDYGEWDGARRAVDEFFEAPRDRLLLQRIDHAARMAVKV